MFGHITEENHASRKHSVNFDLQLDAKFLKGPKDAELNNGK